VIALECLNPKYLAPKRRERKMKGKKMCWYLNSLKVTLPEREGLATIG